MIQNKKNSRLEEEIDRYINGGLNNEQIDNLWAELIQDEYYLDYLKTVANLKQIVHAKQSVQQRPKVIYQWKRYTGYAAVFVFLILGAFMVFRYQPTFFEMPGQKNLAGNTTFEPLSSISLDVARSGDVIYDGINNELINSAFELAQEGRVTEAINLLEENTRNFEQAGILDELLLVIGSLKYNSNDFEGAEAVFKKVIGLQNVSTGSLEKGHYFLANTYLKMNEPDKAEVAFLETYLMDGAYSRVAKRSADALKSRKK